MEFFGLQNHLQDVEAVELVSSVALIKVAEYFTVKNRLILSSRVHLTFEEKNRLHDFTFNSIKSQVVLRLAVAVRLLHQWMSEE